jgi:hypothetical protein
MQKVTTRRRLTESMVITPPGSIGSAVVTMGPGRWELTCQVPLDWLILRGELVDLVQAAKEVMR